MLAGRGEGEEMATALVKAGRGEGEEMATALNSRA